MSDIHIIFNNDERKNFFVQEDDVPKIKPQVVHILQEFVKEMNELYTEYSYPLCYEVISGIFGLIGLIFLLLAAYVDWQFAIPSLIFLAFFGFYLHKYETQLHKLDPRVESICEDYGEKLYNFYVIKNNSMISDMWKKPTPVAFVLTPAELVIRLGVRNVEVDGDIVQVLCLPQRPMTTQRPNNPPTTLNNLTRPLIINENNQSLQNEHEETYFESRDQRHPSDHTTENN